MAGDSSTVFEVLRPTTMVKVARAARKIDKRLGMMADQVLLVARLEEDDDNTVFEQVQVYPGRYPTYDDGGVD